MPDEEERSEQILHSIQRPSPPLNMINVNPEMIRQMYASLIASKYMSKGEQNAEIEERARQLLLQKVYPITVAAPPAAIAQSYSVDAEAIVNMVMARIHRSLESLAKVIEIVIETGSFTYKDDEGEKTIDLDSLPGFVENRVREVEFDSLALPLALQRLAALYTFNLPPQFRPAIINMSVEGIDVVMQPEEERAKQLEELLEQLAMARQEGGSSRRGRRRRR